MGSGPLGCVDVSQIRHVAGRFPWKDGRDERRPKNRSVAGSLQGGL